MLRKIDHKTMGRSDLGWLKSIFHFSFANYYNPLNTHFGVLRVINDDLVAPNTGFDTHPHKDMEIISYVIDGELTHTDSLGNSSNLKRGHVQYMSAGYGITHSEHNLGKETSRFLQIWIFPDQKGYAPNYGEYRFDWDARSNQLLHIVSNDLKKAPIKINQDANIYVTEIEKDREIVFQVDKSRQAYLVQIEGSSTINQIDLDARDAMEITEEDAIIKAKSKSHLMMIEMKKILD